MKNKKLVDIIIDLNLKEAIGGASIDKQQGVIRNVVLLTGEKTSHNKTFYTRKALTEAVNRYEGAKMFLDHGEGSVRSVSDLGGTYHDLKLEENKLTGNLHLVNRPSVRELVFALAESKVGGLSIRDRGRGREEEGIFLVEGFAKAGPFSIDLVTEPSVNKNLFESTEDKEDQDMKLSEVTKEDLIKENPGLVEAIKQESKAETFKEVEEKIKKGEDAEKILSQGKKLVALAEAGLPKEVTEAVRKMIEPEGITFEMAEGIIKGQREIVSKFGDKGVSPKDPHVKNNGKNKDLEEGEKIPSDDDFASALK